MKNDDFRYTEDDDGNGSPYLAVYDKFMSLKTSTRYVIMSIVGLISDIWFTSALGALSYGTWAFVPTLATGVIIGIGCLITFLWHMS